MQTNLIDGLRIALADNARAPQLAEVIETHAGNKHAVDVEIIKPVSREKTGEMLQEVPLSPLWAGTAGHGIYAPPQPTSHVIIAFIDGNGAHPFVLCPYGLDYPTADHDKNALTITDGKANICITEQSLITIASATQNLHDLLAQLLDELMKLQTQGGPTNQLVSAANITNFIKIKSDLAQLLQGGT